MGARHSEMIDPATPPFREARKSLLFRVEDQVVISTADKASLEEHGREQSVFLLPREVLHDDYKVTKEI
jgi:hypothetical protein